MAGTSSIEWTDATWNPLRGCTRASRGCGAADGGGCYAERVAARFSGPGQPYEGLAEMRGGKPRWTGKLAFVEGALTTPLRWRKPRRIFVNSMSDLFHESVPDAWIDRIFAVMALAPQHTFQCLTKRSARMRAYCTGQATSDRIWEIARADAIGDPFLGPWFFHSSANGLARRWPGPSPWPLANVWLGVSAEDQERADERVPDLLATPAAVRFVSAEPLLGPIDFLEKFYVGGWCNLSGGADIPGLGWVIVGGESGPGARPMHPNWTKSIRDQCAAAGVPFFFKQWGEHLPVAVVDDPRMAGGRAFDHPAGGRMALRIRVKVGGTFRGAEYRDMRPGDRNGCGELLDEGTMAVAVGKKAAGRLLDGVEHNGMPAR